MRTLRTFLGDFFPFTVKRFLVLLSMDDETDKDADGLL